MVDLRQNNLVGVKKIQTKTEEARAQPRVTTDSANMRGLYR